MSNARICDRCRAKISCFTGIRVEIKYLFLKTKCDLCQNCINDFKRFIENKEQSNEPR